VAKRAQSAPAKRKKSSIPQNQGLLSRIGGRIGNIFGSRGQRIGAAAGNLMGSIFGMGSYSVKSNSLVAGPPVFKASSSGGIVVAHREFITDITGSTGFNLASYPINPGLSQTFPWLSSLANNFEQYRLHGLVFEFKSTSATAVSSTNTALGTVVMATEYDVLDSSFANKQAMEAYEYSTSSSPTACMLHPIECDPRQNVLSNMYLRYDDSILPVSSDLRMYDMGNTQIATVGMQAASVIGELWVSYNVEFLKPKLRPVSRGAYLEYTSTLVGSTTTSDWNHFPELIENVGIDLVVTNPGVDSTTFTYNISTPGTYLFQTTVLGDGTGNFRKGDHTNVPLDLWNLGGSATVETNYTDADGTAYMQYPAMTLGNPGVAGIYSKYQDVWYVTTTGLNQSFTANYTGTIDATGLPRVVIQVYQINGYVPPTLPPP